MIEYEIPFVCLIFTTLILLIFNFKKKVNLEENYYFNNILIFTFLVNLFNLISHYGASIYLVNGVDSWYASIFSIINKIGSWFIIIICFNMLAYILYISYEKYRKNFNILKIVNNIFYMIIGVIIFNLDFIAIKRGNITGGKGSAVILTFVLIFTALFLSVIISLLNLKRYDKRYLSVYIILPLIIGLGIFVVFHPEFNVYDLILCLLCYLMYFTIENPDLKIVEELSLAKVQAEQANRAKTDFLSSMSHEIRTPLNAIVGFSEIIGEANSLEEAKANSKDIINASQTLLEIVNGVLDISKIEAGKLEIVNTKYNPRETFFSLAKLIEPKMKEHDLEFTYHFAEDLPNTLIGDHANIKKIILNFLSNAAKYTKKGYVNFIVKCINSEKTTRLIIDIEDSGIGIKDEDIDKLFSKFERLEVDKHSTIEGTGLGLAITKKLVELMNGKIIVHTIYGEGSKFTVILDQEISDEKIINVEKTNESIDLSPYKILVVDDNELNIKVLIKILEKLNLKNVDSCNNGYDVINKIRNKEKYDLILLDDMMPKLTGVETLNRLKEIDKFNIPVVVLTANAVSGMKENYLEKGFNDYLSKPIDKTELIRVLSKFLNNKSKVYSYDEATNDSSSNSLNEESKKFLEANNVDVTKALAILGDIEMYNETVNDFLDEVEDKWNRIKLYLENKDMPSYSVEVHSLKSDAKYLGLTKLADISYDHELKSKENNYDGVLSSFNLLEKEYNDSLKIIKEYKNKYLN